MDSITIGIADGDAHGPISRFYDAVGYTGGVEPADTILVARDPHRIVAVVRLTMEHGHLLLRGMQVAADMRRRGLGALLLRATVEAIHQRECWCIPHQHLVLFYGRAGFVEAQLSATPAFLRDRRARYMHAGHAVTVMVRRVAAT